MAVPANIKANSDASSVAAGAVLVMGKNTYTAHKNLAEDEKIQSSTWRELDAVLFAVKSFSTFIKEKRVNWETDNQAVPVIISKGSKVRQLQALAKELYFTCRDNVHQWMDFPLLNNFSDSYLGSMLLVENVGHDECWCQLGI